MANWVESPEAAVRLAERVLDPAREEPIVCVTIPAWASQPLLDLAALEEALDGMVDVWVMPTGDISWEFSYRLPTGLDVYGGAVRLWWPGVDERADRHAHPLFLVYDQKDSPAVVERVVAELHKPVRADPDVGSEHAAVVTRVLPHGAELTLTGGTAAFAYSKHLTRHDLAPAQVVRAGQAVRVRVSERGKDRQRVPVSLLPFEPDPWDRLAAEYPPGAVLEGEVTDLRNIGALVRLLPDVKGLVHKSKITHDWLSHPEDVLSLGQRVRVRVEWLDVSQHRVELSMLDIPAGEPAGPAAIYPDGPPWLEPAAVPRPSPLLMPLAPAREPATEPATEPELEPELEPEPESVPAHPPTQPAAEATSVVAGEAFPRSREAADLEQAVGQAREVQQQIRAMFEEGERRLARLRGEAAHLRRALEGDLAEVRRRILELAESETSQLVGSTQEALDQARAEAEQLRERLAAVEEDRQRMLSGLKDNRARRESAERVARDTQQELRRERDTVEALKSQLRRLAPDEQEQFREEIRAAWLSGTTPADRDRYPWREPVIGPEFVDSLAKVQGVSRERVVEVCAEVVCRRARERAGLEVHALRSSDGGGTPQRVRTDGAKAFRASLQSGTPAARRLHYWELPDGGVELAKVVYHDDFSIR